MSVSQSPKLLAIVGPTASGKTGLACSVARRFGGEIVGMDASQIYRGFNIGTGKASKVELGGILHHNIDTVDPDVDYNAARFVRETKPTLSTILSRGKLPIFCGGAGLYFRALREGLCRAPKVPDEIRDSVLKEISERGVESMHESLTHVDPITASRIHFRDRQRIERALSVYRFTGKALSEWMREGSFSGVNGEWLVLGLRWETQALKSRISKRVHQMVADGWLEEIEEIVGRGYGDQVRAFTAIGYQFMLQVLEGTKTLDEAIDLTVRQTQKYAKRQMTWFRREHDVQWLDCPIDEQSPLEIVANFLGDCP